MSAPAAALAVALLVAPLAAAWAGEARASLACAGRPGEEALALVSRLTGIDHELATEALLAGLGGQPAHLHLVDASSASQRQAVAHALGCWWARSAERGVVLLRDPRLPLGELSARVHTSGLRGRTGLEAAVRTLLAPWLGRGAGLAYEADSALWSATLDPDGHARLVELLTLLERAQPQCPSLVGDPDQPTGAERLDQPLGAESWTELAPRLASALGMSVSLGPALVRADLPAPRLAAGALAAVRSACARQGVHSEVVRGVLCLDTQPVLDREHPAQRRRLALIPIPHLAASPVDGELIAATLRRRIRPAWWEQPGAGLAFLAEERALLIAADPVVLHAVLDGLQRIDQLGLDAGLAVLETTDRQATGGVP